VADPAVLSETRDLDKTFWGARPIAGSVGQTDQAMAVISPTARPMLGLA
jgi:hypothetical protein